MPTTLKDALKAKILGSELLGQGIYGIGICESECPIHPDYDNESTIHIYSNKRARIPSRILDVEVEHVLTHRIRTFAIQGGASVSNTYCACAGTLGAQVFDATDGTPLLLSNAHVFCLDQRANWVNNLKGIPVVSPSVYDGGTSANTIGNVLRWASLNSYSPALADWAVANMVSYTVSTGIAQIGAIAGIQDFDLGESVEIVGRTSGLMQGKIADTDALVSVDGYGFGSVNFDHQIVTTSAIAGPGDSGAVGVNPNNHLAGGLLFSGSNTITIFNPMTAVSNYANIVFNVGDKVPPLPANFASALSVSPLLLAAVGAGIVAYWIFNR